VYWKGLVEIDLGEFRGNVKTGPLEARFRGHRNVGGKGAERVGRDKQASEKFTQLGCGWRTGEGDQEALGKDMGPIETEELLSAGPLNFLWSPRDGQGKRISRPECLEEQIMGSLLGIIARCQYFADDDIPFALDLLGGQGRIEAYVDQHFESELPARGGNGAMDTDKIAFGKGVDIAADPIDIAGDVEGRTGPGSFE
jgi:hypothetical protein